MNPLIISASRISKDVYCFSSPTAILSQKVEGLWEHEVGIKGGRARKAGGMSGNPWLSFGYTLLLGLLGYHNTPDTLLRCTRVHPEVKKAKAFREFSSPKPQTKKIIQFQLDDT